MGRKYSSYPRWICPAVENEIRHRASKVEKIRALDRAEAWDKEQARREAKEKNRLNKEENRRLIALKAAEREVHDAYRRARTDHALFLTLNKPLF